MKEACVLGNGTSRLQFNLDEVQSSMTTYGCNALYRDFIPDYLISMDSSMVDEILKANAHHKTQFWTQHTNRIDDIAKQGEPINFFWGQKETIDSGNSALTLALQNGHEVVYMLGFDYSTDISVLPNVYVGTPNYNKTHVWPAASKRDTQWVNRLRSILKNYPNQKVIRVNGTRPSDISQINYSEITIQQFKDTLHARIFV